MLTCVPMGVCSWNYRVLGGEAGESVLTFDHFTEQGSIVHGDSEFAVRKHGPFSGHWTLEHAGEVFVDALKPNAFFRTFELTTADGPLTIRAVSSMRRGFEIVTGDGRIVGSIEPEHAFTRRASMNCDTRVPELVQLFAFWLVAIAWRRAKNNS